MNEPFALHSILQHSSTLHFLGESSDQADFGDIDLFENPQKSSYGPFVWLSADRSEASVTFIGKVIYDGIGNKIGPYFSLPEDRWVSVLPSALLIVLYHLYFTQMSDVTADDMAKVKAGFAIRTVNDELVADVMVPDELKHHAKATVEFFLSVQEASDQKLGEYHTHSISFVLHINAHPGISSSPSGPFLQIKPFLKVENRNPFYVIPVISEPLFPQFKGPSTPGFTRSKRQRGLSLIVLALMALLLIVLFA